VSYRDDVILLLRSSDKSGDAKSQMHAAAALATIIPQWPEESRGLAGRFDPLAHQDAAQDDQELTYYRAAIAALGAIGQPAIAPLLAAFSPDRSRADGNILYALGRMKGKAAEAVATIVEVGLRKPDALAIRAVAALGDIGPAARDKSEMPVVKHTRRSQQTRWKLRAFASARSQAWKRKTSESVDAVIKI